MSVREMTIAPVRRSGVRSSSLATLADQGWLAFPQAPAQPGVIGGVPPIARG